MKLKNNHLTSLDNKQWSKNLDRHQKRKILYARNGPAILITKTNILLKGKLYGQKIIPYIMSPEKSVDIDQPLDFKLAEFYLKNKNKNS
jgi:CMP-N,N'-diacetyllegionaminic acid synthase